MLKEIEKKFHVVDFREIEKVLLQAGAILDKVTMEQDIYFNVSGRDSMATKECLRIRSTNEKKEITYKPPTLAGQNLAHFAKKETNILVTDINLAKDFLISLGNTILVDFVKHRKYYHLNGVTITLDTLNDRQFFVEIEVESNDESLALEKITEIEKLLTLSPLQIETRPYRDIAMNI